MIGVTKIGSRRRSTGCVATLCCIPRRISPAAISALISAPVYTLTPLSCRFTSSTQTHTIDTCSLICRSRTFYRTFSLLCLWGTIFSEEFEFDNRCTSQRDEWQDNTISVLKDSAICSAAAPTRSPTEYNGVWSSWVTKMASVPRCYFPRYRPSSTHDSVRVLLIHHIESSQSLPRPVVFKHIGAPLP